MTEELHRLKDWNCKPRKNGSVSTHSRSLSSSPPGEQSFSRNTAARYYGQTSSARLYTGSGKKPGFTKKPTVDERLNENPPTESSESSGGQQGERGDD